MNLHEYLATLSIPTSNSAYDVLYEYINHYEQYKGLNIGDTYKILSENLNKSEKSIEKVLMRCIKYTFNKMPYWIKHKLFRNTLAKDELPCVLHYIKTLALRFDDFKKFE